MKSNGDKNECPFAIGGFNFASAYTQSRSVSGLKADFFEESHYSPSILYFNLFLLYKLLIFLSKELCLFLDIIKLLQLS